MRAPGAATRETTTLKNRREAERVTAGVARFGFSAAPGQRLCYLVGRGEVMRLVADAMLGRLAKWL
ncbi:MAG TPA: hypothetical protein VFF86_07255, partial [Candidatus Methylomirabilis sp.]|nr:hypothetical protein [Candidatus Methylomirabilis sp.]